MDRTLIFFGSAVLLVSELFNFASRTCDRPSLIRFCGNEPRNPWRLLLVACRNAVLSSPPGAYEKLICGVIECLKRVTGPNPGKSANSVGEAPRPALMRLDWCTNLPPLRCERTQNPFEPSTFSSEICGERLSAPCPSCGKLKLVCQSMRVR